MKRALLFGGVPVIAGIALIVMWAMADQEASRGHDWTQVLATVESTNVQPGAVDIAYRYNFGGREHRNPAGRLTLRDAASQSNVATRYAPGRQILTYVNPAAPAESQLEPKARPSTMNIIAGMVLLIIGLPIATYFLTAKQPAVVARKKGREPAPPMSRLKPPPAAPRK
jgi:hypothetical protein